MATPLPASAGYQVPRRPAQHQHQRQGNGVPSAAAAASSSPQRSSDEIRSRKLAAAAVQQLAISRAYQAQQEEQRRIRRLRRIELEEQQNKTWPSYCYNTARGCIRSCGRMGWQTRGLYLFFLTMLALVTVVFVYALRVSRFIRLNVV